MTVSITKNGFTFTFAAGEVQRVSSSTAQIIDQQNVYGSGASTKKIIILESPSKTISVSGVLFATDTTRITTYNVKTILQQKTWLESIFNGSSDTIIFNSTYEQYTPTKKEISSSPPYLSTLSTTKGFSASIDFNEIEGESNILAFSLLIIIGESYSEL